MNPWVVEIGLGALSAGAWLALYGVLLLATRPRGVEPTPATPELGPEPPAVASLVASGWKLTEDAAEATLLDLGARKIIEFRQPADDPMHTTIHVGPASPGGLARYEKRTLDRVNGLAVGGVVPMTALTFRDRRKAQSWWRHLRAEIVADARARGLSRRRFGSAMAGMLVAAAAVAGLGVLVAVLHHEIRTDAEDPWDAAWSGGLFTFLVLAAFALRSPGERDTPAGREAAARWLGVRDWLRAHDAFADLPPSAVAVWDRYLPYGAALGTTRVASAVIDMGMGNRKRVWSSFGGAWHRVRVRYPRWGSRYGATVMQVVFPRLVAVFFGYVLVRWWRPVIADLATVEQLQNTAMAQRSGLIQTAGFVLGLAPLAYGIYGIVRIVIDLVTPASVTGQVLWIDVWRVDRGGDNSPSRPKTYYLAIDDGKSDRTTAWALPAALHGRCDTGDTVTVTVRRWTRRVGQVTLVERGTAGHADGTEAGHADQEKLVAALLGGGGAASEPLRSSATLLTVDEVEQALGLRVIIVDTPVPGPIRMVQYATADRKKAVLLVQVAGGMMGRLAWKTNSRGTPVPGIGDGGVADGAVADGDRAAARCGDVTIVLTLMGDAKGRGNALPELLRQAVSRVTEAAVGSHPEPEPA